MKIEKVPIGNYAQTRMDQMNYLSQMSGPEPQITEFLQTGAQTAVADSTIGSNHVIMDLTNNNNYGYIGKFFLGTVGGEDDTCTGKKQEIRILLDTGSANSWIMSEEALPDDYDEATVSDKKRRHVFDPEKSCGGTFDEPDDDHKQHVHITFGSGDLRGYFVHDTCTIGDIESDNDDDRLILPNYQFGMVTQETAFHSTFDAIIGMAYPKFAEPNVTPFFDSMMEAEILKQNVFAFHMSMNPDEEDSEVMFGDWNVDKIDQNYNNGTGQLNWHPVQDKLFWSIGLDDILVDGESTGLCTGDKKCLFTPDTGTSLITFPSWATQAFKSKYSDLTTKHVCSNEFGYGNLTYVMNGIHYPIPSHHFMQRTVNNKDETGDTCESSIGNLDVGQPNLDNLFIGGDVFMQIYYTVFDRDLDMVGFAKAQHTAPEIVNLYDQDGHYVETQKVCSEGFTDQELCTEEDDDEDEAESESESESESDE